MLYVAESKKSLDRMAAGLQHALTRHEFGTLGVHDLKQVMARLRPTALLGVYPHDQRTGVGELEAVLVDTIDEAIAEP